MTDAMDLFNAMRPPSLAPSGEDIRPVAQRRPVQTVGGSRDLHDLAMVPGSAAYRARIPRPPCFQCAEDHVAGQAYDHDWMPEPQPVHDEPVAASAVLRRTQPSAQVIEVAPTLVAFRVALYVGRGDTYVVAVETPPDWDQHVAWKVEPRMVLPLINLARALQQKVVDKTGGDLLMLEQEYAGQHAQNNGRGAAPAGDPGARRQGSAADWPQEGEPSRDEQAD